MVWRHVSRVPTLSKMGETRAIVRTIHAFDVCGNFVSTFNYGHYNETTFTSPYYKTLPQALLPNSPNILQPLQEIIPSNWALQLIIRSILRNIKVIPHTWQIHKLRWWNIARRLTVNKERVTMRRNSQRRGKHIWSHSLAKLVDNAAGLRVGRDQVEEVAEDWERGVWSIGVGHYDCVFGRVWV